MKKLRIIARQIDIIWVEDKKQYLPSVEDEIKELEKDFNVRLAISEENNSSVFVKVASNIPSDLVFCVDYNLKIEDENGVEIGIDGDQVIRNIRAVNPNCIIVFYSAKLNQEELRNLIGNDDEYTVCVYRPNLLAKLRSMLEDGDI